MFKKLKQSIEDKEQAPIHNYGLSKQTASTSRRVSTSSQKSLHALGSDKESYQLVRHSYQHLPTAVDASHSTDLPGNNKQDTHNNHIHYEEKKKNNLPKIENNHSIMGENPQSPNTTTASHPSVVSPVEESTDILDTIENTISQTHSNAPTIDDVDLMSIDDDDKNMNDYLVSNQNKEICKNYEEKIKKIENELSKKNIIITKLENELSIKNKDIEDLQSKIKKYMEENTKHGSDVKQLLLKKTELEKAVELNHGEISQLHSQLLGAQDRNKACNHEIKRKEEEIECLRNENQALRSQIEKLQADLDSQSEKYTLISSRHEEEMKEKNKAIKKMEQKLLDMKKLFHKELNVQNKLSIKNETPQLASSIITSNSYTNVSLHACGSDNNPVEWSNENEIEIKGEKNDKVLSSSSSNINNDSDLDQGILNTNCRPDSISNKTSCKDGDENHQENNEVYITNETRQKRLSSATIEASTELFINQHPGNIKKNALDNLNDTNFKYLKHVLMKFLLCREHEAMQLMRVVSVLLKFSREEENLLRDTLLWKTSWFGTRPPLPPSMHL